MPVNWVEAEAPCASTAKIKSLLRPMPPLCTGRIWQLAVIDAVTAYAREKTAEERLGAERRYAEANREAAVDYQRLTNLYGYNAELLAGIGLSQSGLAESSLIAHNAAYAAAQSANFRRYNETLSVVGQMLAKAELEGEQSKAKLLREIEEQIAKNDLELAEKQQKQLLEEYERQQKQGEKDKPEA